jgi:hypothetical protein
MLEVLQFDPNQLAVLTCGGDKLECIQYVLYRESGVARCKSQLCQYISDHNGYYGKNNTIAAGYIGELHKTRLVWVNHVVAVIDTFWCSKALFPR